MKDARSWHVSLGVACVVSLAGCASPGPAAVPDLRPGLLQGYLPTEARVDSLALLPPPPAPGSVAMALDEEVARRAVALHATPRWTQAILDADLRFPGAAGTFSCAIGIPITEASTPHLYQLLRRSLTDAAFSTSSAKAHYKRTRPFVAGKTPICTPAEQARLEEDGSYPSGHVTVGWVWALVLAEVAPERAAAILARGLAFGESRNVCNLHWHSDVIQSQVLGAGVAARLHAEPEFRADLEAARAEVAALRAQGARPSRDCAAEAAALAR